MASTASSRTFESWTLAAVSTTASGTPSRSETTWRFEPAFPLSVGFGPVFGPPFWPARSPSPKKPYPTRSGRTRPEPVEQDPMQLAPHPRLLPVAQPPPEHVEPEP